MMALAGCAEAAYQQMNDRSGTIEAIRRQPRSGPGLLYRGKPASIQNGS